MMRIRFERDMDTMRVDSDEPSYEDVLISVYGPRSPFTLVNEANGMLLHFTGNLNEAQLLVIDARARACYIGKTALATDNPANDFLHIPPHQRGWGWMRLAAGRNVLKIVPLAGV